MWDIDIISITKLKSYADMAIGMMPLNLTLIVIVAIMEGRKKGNKEGIGVVLVKIGGKQVTSVEFTMAKLLVGDVVDNLFKRENEKNVVDKFNLPLVDISSCCNISYNYIIMDTTKN